MLLRQMCRNDAKVRKWVRINKTLQPTNWFAETELNKTLSDDIKKNDDGGNKTRKKNCPDGGRLDRTGGSTNFNLQSAERLSSLRTPSFCCCSASVLLQ